MLKVEFHCHTNYSKDSWSDSAALVAAARKKGIDRLVITDHNTICGALEAKKIDPELVIVGEEVLTQQGELLAVFVKEAVPACLPPLEAVGRLQEQGAFISVSHPFDIQRKGWKESKLIELLPYLDAIEVFNSRSLHGSTNERAAIFAQKYALAGTVGSDAHLLWEVGRSIVELPEFTDAETLRTVIGKGIATTQISPFWVHLGSTLASITNRMTRQKRKSFLP